MTRSKLITFGPGYGLHKALEARTAATARTANAVARRDLERWYAVLEQVLRGIELGPAEVLLLVEAVEKTPDREVLVGTLTQVLESSEMPGYGHVRPWLVTKSELWSVVQRWAVVDACERYIIAEKEGGTTADILHRMGLNPYGINP